MQEPGAQASTSECLYSILGLSRDATASDIKLAYRRLALQHHPDKAADKATATARFAHISRAYNTLSDAAKRRYYNEHGTDEGIETSAEDFLEQFTALMQEFTGGLPIQELLAGMSPQELAAMPPFPFPKDLFPPGSFPEGLRFSKEGLKAVPPAVQELLASGDTASLQQLLAEGAAKAAAAQQGTGAGWFDWGLDDGGALGDLNSSVLEELPPGLLACIDAGDAAGVAAFLQQMPQATGSVASQQDQQMLLELTQQLAALSALADTGSASDAGSRSDDGGSNSGNSGSSSNSEWTPCSPDDDEPDGLSRVWHAADVGSSKHDQQPNRLREKLPAKPCAQPAAAASESLACHHTTATDSGVTRTLAARWVEAAKAGEGQQLRRLLAAHPQLLHHQSGALRSSALHWLAAKGHAAALQELLQLGADPELLNATGSTPLHAACAGGHAECVQVLLASGRASAELCNEEGLTAAELALHHGHPECSQRVAGAAAVGSAAGGHDAAVATSVLVGPAVLGSQPGACSSVQGAADMHGSPSCAAAAAAPAKLAKQAAPGHDGQLLSKSATLNSASSKDSQQANTGSRGTATANGSTHTDSGPTAPASCSCSDSTTNAGLAVQERGQQPLQASTRVTTAAVQQPATIGTALSADTQPAARPAPSPVAAAAAQAATEGASADAAACHAADAGPAEAAGTSSSQTESSSDRPAIITPAVGRAWLDAAKAGRLEILQEMLQHLPALLTYNGQGTSYGFVGHSALHWAAAKGHAACVQWLLDQGADATQLRNNAGSTALHAAAANGQVECARLLMLQGAADMLALNDLEESARAVGAARGHHEVVAAMDACHAALKLLNSPRESWAARTMLVFLQAVGASKEAALCLERHELQQAVDSALHRFNEAKQCRKAAAPSNST